MDKEDAVDIYNGILFSHKKEQNNAICSNMGGPRDCHTEWLKSDRKEEISYDPVIPLQGIYIYIQRKP